MAGAAPTGDDAAPPLTGWIPARVPGGVADALRAAGRSTDDLDEQDWWFRADLSVPAGTGRLLLRLDGLTPPAQVLLDGRLVAEAASMHLPVVVPLPGPCRLHVRFPALAPLLAAPRRPRARWRTRVADGGLRFVRTALLGRAPGFAPGPPLIGPFRAIHVERLAGATVEDVALRPTLDGDDGMLSVRVRVDGAVDAVQVLLTGLSGRYEAALERQDDGFAGEVRVPSVSRWWPHTHGEPVLHRVQLVLKQDGVHQHVEAGRVGFRSLAAGCESRVDVERDGLDLHVNGVRVFARGVVWTRPGGPSAPVDLRALLQQVRRAGMNMVRLPGTGPAETAELADLCDELGVLLWHDAPLANFDYPSSDPAFVALVEQEAHHLLAGLAGRASFAVYCGGSEVEQQAVMFGVPACEARSTLTTEVLPRALAASGADAVWVPGSPCGGDLPFRTSVGIAHYFGVGGYRRPLTDVRRAAVRFASECLAMANLPGERPEEAGADEALLAGLGVPCDVGADWNFADVRDHYLRELYGLDPQALRDTDPARYLQLSREVSGQLAAEVFGEWRRAGSPCAGGLVLWLADQVPGAGWGLLDVHGQPKPVLAPLARVLAPVAVWTTDEGLDGVGLHVANDRADPLAARLQVRLYRGERCTESGEHRLDLGPHEAWSGGVEQVLGRFVDASLAYGFGPAGHDLVVATLTDSASDQPVGQAFRHPLGRPTGAADAGALGAWLELTAGDARGPARLRVGARAHLHAVRVRVPGHEPDDDGFDVEPGGSRTVLLRPGAGAAPAGPPAVCVTAANLTGALSSAGRA